jgi:hypothetical protein
MKTMSFQSRSLLLIPVILIFFAISSQAQNKPGAEKTTKQKYSIHIVKDVNGERTEIDTTFESNADFDVDAWIGKHDFKNEMDGKKREMEKKYTITIPDFASDSQQSNPDTIIMNEDTIIMNTQFEHIFGEGPEQGEMGREGFFNKHFEFPECPAHSEMPECCPSHGFPGMGMMPFHGLSMFGLENLMPLGKLDQIVIKKKRHGKKIIITFEDDDENIVIRPGKYNHKYFNDAEHSNMKHSKAKRIVIEKEIAPGADVEEGSNVERYNDGNKEVIIIRKKPDGKK